MKKILTVSILTSSLLFALPVKNDVKQELELLKQQIQQLQQENKKLKALEAEVNKLKSKINDNSKYKKEVTKLKSKVNDNASYIEEVDNNVGSLKAKVIKNTRLGFTRLKFDTTAHSFYYKTADGKSYSNKNVDTINLKLNLETDISNKLTFRGQLSMYKYWSQGDYYPYSNYDNMQGRVPSDSSLYVTRAYIDYKVLTGKIPTILTIGRQPTSSGPSWQYSNNGMRYGTYDALVFDGNADGIVATMLLDQVLPLHNSALRFAYGKGFQNNGFNKNTDNGIADTNVYGIFFESNLPSIKNSFTQIYVSTARSISNENTVIGDINWLGGMFELNNISNFDFFAHVALSQSKPNGNLSTINSNGDKGGLLTNQAGDTKDKIGSAIWLGTRYTFTSNAKLGIEYGHGSKNWINMTQGSDNILNPRSVRGDVWDIYGIYPIDKSAIGVNAFIKIGTTLIDYKYTNSGMPYGAPQKITSDMENADKITDSLNDYYMNFQVNY